MGQAERQGLGSHRRRRADSGRAKEESRYKRTPRAPTWRSCKSTSKEMEVRAPPHSHFISLFSALLLMQHSLSLAKLIRPTHSVIARRDDDVRDNRLSGLLRQEEDEVRLARAGPRSCARRAWTSTYVIEDDQVLFSSQTGLHAGEIRDYALTQPECVAVEWNSRRVARPAETEEWKAKNEVAKAKREAAKKEKDAEEAKVKKAEAKLKAKRKRQKKTRRMRSERSVV